jgi:hypothetical protein
MSFLRCELGARVYLIPQRDIAKRRLTGASRNQRRNTTATPLLDSCCNPKWL